MIRMRLWLRYAFVGSDQGLQAFLLLIKCQNYLMNILLIGAQFLLDIFTGAQIFIKPVIISEALPRNGRIKAET